MATFQERINQFRQGLDTQQQHFNDAMGQASQYGQRVLEDKFGQHYENVEKTGGAVLTAGLTTGATIKGFREIAHNYKAKKAQLAEARSKNTPATATEQQGGGKQSVRPADDDVNKSAPVLQEPEGREGGGRAETKDEAPEDEAGVLGREALEEGGEGGEREEEEAGPAEAPRQAPAPARQAPAEPEPVRGELTAGRGDLDFSLGGTGGGGATASNLFSNLPARQRTQKPAKPDAEPAPPEEDEDENTFGFPGKKYVEPEGGQLAPQANQPKGKQPAGQPEPARPAEPSVPEEGATTLVDSGLGGQRVANIARADDATQAVARGGEAVDTLKAGITGGLGEGVAGAVGQALGQAKSTGEKVAGGALQGTAGLAQGGRAVSKVVGKVRGTTAGGEVETPSAELADQGTASLADQAVASAKSWVGRQVSNATDAISSAGRSLGTSLGVEDGAMDAISAVGGAMMEAVPILGDITGAGMLIYGVVKEIEDAKKHADDPVQYSAQTLEPTEQAGGLDTTALGGAKSTGGAGIV